MFEASARRGNAALSASSSDVRHHNSDIAMAICLSASLILGR
jgi:hypothetical protein